ncbi:MAG: hypothetical protein R6V16_01140 [Bacteroidales bacterium]
MNPVWWFDKDSQPTTCGHLSTARHVYHACPSGLPAEDGRRAGADLVIKLSIIKLASGGVKNCIE